MKKTIMTIALLALSATTFASSFQCADYKVSISGTDLMKIEKNGIQLINPKATEMVSGFEVVYKNEKFELHVDMGDAKLMVFPSRKAIACTEI